ncbi:hypothetical protein [Roseivivax sediminis]|uniref:Porin n=1 Tax=Roseivivax sediminis TaxID=936889 RepID=A0A1I1YDP8_9RHOB|nr:hypothetical protein [Roseivivax sediminis]SFE17696.1 hypothetical protein SAMN04515678_1071 [Roseivivax sediminis]
MPVPMSGVFKALIAVLAFALLPWGAYAGAADVGSDPAEAVAVQDAVDTHAGAKPAGRCRTALVAGSSCVHVLAPALVGAPAAPAATGRLSRPMGSRMAKGRAVRPPHNPPRTV